nr:hypothetical transcript [Hymenolepis microstoma]
MRSFSGEAEVKDSILQQLWINCLPVNMAACLVASTYRNALNKLIEAEDGIQQLYFLPCVQAVETPILSPITPQQLDILTKLLQKKESNLANIFESRDVSSSEPRSQFNYYHRTHGDDARKCQSGHNCPKVVTPTQRETSSVLKSALFLICQKNASLNIPV